MQPPESIRTLKFPVLLWRKGYSYVANSPLELCTHPRSLFADTKRRAQGKEFVLADADGRIYRVADFDPVRSFGGIKGIAHLILRSVYAAPVLQPMHEIELSEFSATIGKALRGRFGKAFAAELAVAESPSQVLERVAQQDQTSG